MSQVTTPKTAQDTAACQAVVDCYGMLPGDVWRKVLSVPDYPDIVRFFSTCKKAPALREENDNSLERFHFERVEIFDRTLWEKYWGKKITDEFEPSKVDIVVLREFLKTFWGPIPKDVGTGKVKDNCLMPTVVPVEVRVADKVSKFCHKELKALTWDCEEGHVAKYVFAPSVRDHESTGITKARLVILLKGVLGRGAPWSKEPKVITWLNGSEVLTDRGQVQILKWLNDKANYGCETEPDGLSQNTVLLAHHAATGQFPFGDDKGLEGKKTYGRTRETCIYPNFHMVSGGFSHANPWSQLNCNANSDDFEYIGVAVMKKFQKP